MSDTGRERRPIRALLGIAGGIVALGLVGWATAHSLGLAAEDDAGVWLPSTPRGELALIDRNFARDQAVAPADRARLAALAARSPLASEPFSYLGFAALQDDDVERAEALLVEARDRRPRSRLARLSLLQIKGQQGDLEGMVAELVPLMRLEPELVEPLALEWLKILRRPSEVAMLARILAPEPKVFERVAGQAARAKLDPALLAAFVSAAPMQGDEIDPRTTGQLIAAMVDQGAYREAFASWKRRAASERTDARGLYNAEFTDRAAAPPFNWELTSSRQGSSEWTSGGGAYVDYFGRGNDTFVRQLVMLAPGRYRLTARQTAEGNGGLAWTVRCAAGGARLLDRPIAAGPAFDASFVVPAGCAAQWIALEGRGELRRGEGQRLAIERVDVAGGDAAR